MAERKTFPWWFVLPLFLSSFVFIVWIERNCISQVQAVLEAAQHVNYISSQFIDERYTGLSVLLRGQVDYEELVDEEYGIRVHALQLSREVEQYTSHQTTKRDEKGVETTSTEYRWESIPKESSFFSRSWSPIRSKTFIGIEGITRLGVFPLPEEVKKQLRESSKEKMIDFLDPAVSITGKALQSVVFKDTGVFQSGHTIGKALEELEVNPLVHLSVLWDRVKPLQKWGEYVYTGHPWQPVINDIRIQWKLMKPVSITMMGQQETNNDFHKEGDGEKRNVSVVPYKASNNKTVLLSSEGELTSDELMNTGEKQAAASRIFPLLGSLLWMYVSMRWLFHPIDENSGECIVQSIPCIGARIMSIVGGEVVDDFGFPFCIVFLMWTMAATWISVQPWHALFLFASSFIAFIFGAAISNCFEGICKSTRRKRKYA